MASGKAFFDTNVLLYLFSADIAKADVAEGIMVNGGVISAQVLNEFASVGRRKNGLISCKRSSRIWPWCISSV